MADTGALNPSEHFWFGQMVRKGFVPTPEQSDNLVWLCEQVMEQIRSIYSQPPEIVKGWDPEDELHREGLACDFRLSGVPLVQLSYELVMSTMPIARAYIEPDGMQWHIHVEARR